MRPEGLLLIVRDRGPSRRTIEVASAISFLETPSRFFFFTGKGGVGKTSLACAAALALAARGKRVLLVSTDPASNLDDVFGVPIAGTPTPIPAVERLFALNVDPEAAAAVYRESVVGPYRGMLPEDAIAHMEEQLSGACTVEIAAFDRFTSLLLDDAIAERFDHVLFDTAPTGHTLRLLSLPAAWSSFLESSEHGASCLGPLSGLAASRGRYGTCVAALADPERTALVLVARPDPSALREAERTGAELAALGLAHQHLIVNGLLPAPRAGAAPDPVADAMRRRAQEALASMPTHLATLPRTEVPLRPENMVGLDALRGLLASDSSAATADPPASIGSHRSKDVATLGQLVDRIEADGHGAILAMGKGGVGKTTIAAAIAVALARRGHDVHLTTTDPAAHVGATLGGAVPHLTVDRLDPVAETAAYRAEVLATSGSGLDSAGRALLEEDLRSPCTEEVAVFRAFGRVLAEASERFVVIDTAPTGHTLLLMDATGSYHRELERSSRGSAPPRTPLRMLQDPKYTKALIVTLAEPTPILEARRLEADLRRAGIEPAAWIINASLAAIDPPPHEPILARRAAAEHGAIDMVATHAPGRTHLVPWRIERPVGADALAALTRP